MIDAHIELPDGEESLNFLDEALEFSGVTGVIVVQREPNQLANQACLDLANNSDGLVSGMVAWTPLADERLLKVQLDADRREKPVCGYLADIHHKNIEQWNSDEDVHHGVGLLAQIGKPLDLLLMPSQLPAILPFLDAHADSPLVIDHCFEDPVTTESFWPQLLREIGRRPHVYYRLSGLAPVANTETAYEATESVKETFNAALEAFGPKRLLYASGWPLAQARYPVWLNTVDNLIHALSNDERAAIFGKNAEEIYVLS